MNLPTSNRSTGKYPRLSVVTSVYNGAAYLPACIRGVLSQTFEDFEFILVDDGSTDNTWEIIQQFSQADDRIVPIHQSQNQGVVAGLNQGLAEARGDYIARQDADDISLPDRFQRQVEFLDANPDHGLVACQVSMIDADGASIDTPSPFSGASDEEIQGNLLDHMCLCGPSIMVSREALQAAGCWFGAGLDASEDYDLCLRLAEVTRLASLTEPLYLYRQHAQSATVTQELKQVMHKAAALEQALERRENGDAAIINSTLGRDYLWSAVLAYRQGDENLAKQCLIQTAAYSPQALAQSETLERFIEYRMPLEAAAALEFVRGLFLRLLPQTPVMRRLRSKLISSIHMKEVFAGARQGQQERVMAHLWHGLRENPGWIKNRGVISIALRYGLLRRQSYG